MNTNLDNDLCVRCKSNNSIYDSLCRMCLDEDYKILEDARIDIKTFFNDLIDNTDYQSDMELDRDEPHKYILDSIIPNLMKFKNNFEEGKK